MIIKNSIQCNHCKDIIESKNRHDFKWCKCKTVAVDGGKGPGAYLKRSYTNSEKDFIELSEIVDI